MIDTYRDFQRLVRYSCLVVLLFLSATKSAHACHGLAIVSLSSSQSPTDLTITGSSDPATCGCGPYWMEVEVACAPTTFTGNPPIPSSAAWGTNPWYHSTLNPPGAEACVLEPYFPVTIPFSQLCQGTTYYWRARELVEASATGVGPWSAVFSFTTPGSPPVTTLAAVSSAYSGCPGDMVQLNASIAGGCPGSSYNYSWAPITGLSNPLIANPTLIIQPGNTTYTVTVSGGCVTITSADDTVGIQIGPPPFSGAITANPVSVCAGGSSLLTLSGADPTSGFQWQVSPNGTSWFNISGANASTYNTGPISSTLFYQVIVTGSGWPTGSGCGIDTSAPISVTVNPAPIAGATSSIGTICIGACDTLTGTGGIAYNWQPGNMNTGTVTVCPTANTTYTVTVVDANGCTDTETVTVTVSTPTVTASADVSICAGNSTTIIAAGPGSQNYSWSPAGSLSNPTIANPTATPTVTTNYTVTATNAAGCTAIDSVLVTVTNLPPVAVSNDTTICAGGTSTLTATGAVTYAWSPGNMTGASVTVQPMATTTYVVTGNTNGCLGSASVVVYVNPPPGVFAGPDFSICTGSQATMNVATTANSYLWLPTAGIIGSNTVQSIVISPTVSTSYTVSVSGVGGCISTDTINVSVLPAPNVTATATNTTICQGSSTTLSASGANSYAWTPTVGVANPNQVTTNATPANTTTYQVVGTDANGCSDTASVTITVAPLPSVYIVSTPTECGDSTGVFTVQGVVAGTPPFTYQINGQPAIMPAYYLPYGMHSIIITDAIGCVSTVQIPVYAVNTATMDPIAYDSWGISPVVVNFDPNTSPGINNYFWQFGDAGATSTLPNPSYIYTTPGLYMVTLEAYNDDPNCKLYDTLWIEVIHKPLIELPNVFTPNGDLTNDFFIANISGILDLTVEIFDRWGKVVYSGEVKFIPSTPHLEPLWDGKTKDGEDASEGVYYYVVTAKFYDTYLHDYKGFVHLLRGK